MGNVKKSYEQNNKTADFYRLTDKIERRVCQRSYLLLWMMSIRINNNPSSWSGFTWQHSLSISTQSIGNDRFYSKYYRSSASNVICCDFIPKWIEKHDAIGVNWIHENCWIEEMWPSQWYETRNGVFFHYLIEFISIMEVTEIESDYNQSENGKTSLLTVCAFFLFSPSRQVTGSSLDFLESLSREWL